MTFTAGEMLTSNPTLMPILAEIMKEINSGLKAKLTDPTATPPDITFEAKGNIKNLVKV